MSLKLPGNINSSLFKQGYQVHSNTDGAINRNIQACREISKMISTSIGPCGKNKIIVNNLSKIFITNDAATMIRELDIVHPAVKVLVMHSEQQEEEMGDNTNYVLVLGGELLNLAEKLVVLGLTPTEIIQGFRMANKFVNNELEQLVVGQIDDFQSKEQLLKIIKPVIMSKQYGQERIISDLVATAVQQVMPKDRPQAFNVDSVRVVKIMGGALTNSFVIKGMVFPREPESEVKKIRETAKVAVFNCPVDISASETKGTVLLHNADEMMNFSKGEEDELHKVIKEIADSGVKVIVAGQGIGELALHFMNKYNLLVLKVPSKFDLRRICRICGATPLVRLGAPMPEEMGIIDVVESKEIGSDRVTVFRQNEETSMTSTIVIRGATKNNMDDIERAIDDSVASIKSVVRDPRLLPGAGSTESELVKRVTNYGEKTPGLMQLGIKKFAEAFEFLPRLLCETSGLDPSEILPRLYASHDENDKETLKFGIDIESDNVNDCLLDITEENIYDSYISKLNAINLATEAVCTILSVDQIIVAKKAGGPAMPQQPKPGNWDQAD
ncbi:T-complex protein 1 subunit theta [Pichia kudriavzevii]|uniref:CCT-theta n=1 Tax=Pichia kudriavzevii TaxID=4909 RepID=A0A1V2LWG5_PICKU|nr:T-complex protein 1 subunit theta [Pichia kudriavzevii]